MSKTSCSKARYCIQSDKHPQQITVGLCTLMEHQSLVDIAICCGNSILHAHKVVLAATSPFFREELEKNPTTEQVIITGCEFSIIRSIIEYIYCGETVVEEDALKYLVAAARLFQMKCFENLSLNYQLPGELIVLPKPQFLSKKPKYPAYPFNANLSANNVLKPVNYNLNNIYKPHKVKRKFRIEAEHQACLKEAQASRLAIANLKKEIASAPEANSFVIEESCTETTVENFIPHADRQNFIEIDYENLDNQVFLNPQSFNQESNKSNIIQLTLPNNGQALTTDKIKNLLGNDPNSNIEIMFKTNEGNYVTLTDEVLQNLQKDGLQYQVIDEEGRMGELQELQLIGKDNAEKFDKIAERNVPKEQNCHSMIPFFNNSQLLFGNEPIDMTIDNPKDLVGSVDEHFVQKDVNSLGLNGVDVKPAFLSSNTSESDNSFANITNYFTVRDETIDRTNDAMEIEDTKDNIDVVNSESPILALNNSMKKDDSSPKEFSPDIFFADVSTLSDFETDGHLLEIGNNKEICSGGI